MQTISQVITVLHDRVLVLNRAVIDLIRDSGELYLAIKEGQSLLEPAEAKGLLEGMGVASTAGLAAITNTERVIAHFEGTDVQLITVQAAAAVVVLSIDQMLQEAEQVFAETSSGKQVCLDQVERTRVAIAGCAAKLDRLRRRLDPVFG